MSARLFAAGGSFALVVACTASAGAQEYWRAPDPEHGRKPSHLAFEIRFGPYRPNVDDGVGNVPGTNEGPFQHTFGDNRRYMIGGEVDWQALHVPHFATLGVGGLVGYSHASGTAQFADGDPNSQEEAGLTTWIFGALGVARVDVFAKDAKIPLVPYGKFGPAVGYWSSTNGHGISHDAKTGREGRGHTYGLAYALGVQLMLDFLDPQAAKGFEVERGVKHSYFFFEYTVLNLQGLGQSKALYVGDKTWTLGLLFEI